MKIQNKIILSSTIFGEVIGNIAGWYSIPTMIAEWLDIMEYDFIDNYINNDFNPYRSTVKGVLIWGLISAVTMAITSTVSVKTVEYVKTLYENRRQTNTREIDETTPLLSQTQINSINNNEVEPPLVLNPAISASL
ncbi:hypothetical protein [Spiroplasma endosymbiont of Lariophagus distinguendus]|uniref:hypothetical protein n=1 Tax=Spiroplasma endosymbiont of Lariophagus distinguendus TaxID=2935082 RepID=UPI00207A9B93|nr:hypothetical protein [Spiroplasma endosymbiont of Lariophagus distinguendus]